MTVGVTLRDWQGRPLLERADGQVRYIASPGEGWIGGTDETAVTIATVRAEATSIGRDEFNDRFGGPPWNVPDLDGWFQRRDPDRTFDSYANARAWAFR